MKPFQEKNVFYACGVPVAAVIGDRAACKQAREYIPGIYAAAVKTARRCNVCEIEPDADARIEEAVAGALTRRRGIAPYRLDAPLDVRLTFYRTDFCEDALERNPAAKRPDARTLQRTVNGLTRYEDLKF